MAFAVLQPSVSGRSNSSEPLLAKPGREHRAKSIGECVASVGCGRGTDDGDVNLHGREEALWIRPQLGHRPHTGLALLNELIDACLAHGDCRDLCAREETVHQDEREKHQQFTEHRRPTAHRISGPLRVHIGQKTRP